jgi:site-specific recombinase XerD
MQKTSHEAALFMSDKIRQLCPENPISFNYHQYRWLLKKISIRLGHDFSKTHSARRYFATKIYEKGGKDIKLVQKALGHTSIVSTEKYISVESDALQRAVMSLGE